MKLKNFTSYLIACFYIVITACSTSKIKENNSNASVEQTSTETLEPTLSNGPRALNPESKKSPELLPVSPFYLNPMNGAGAVVAMALAGTAIGLSKIFKTEEVRTDLNGNCVYRGTELPIESPCINVTVNLLDDKNNILTSSSTNQSGDFRFYIPENQFFYVQVIDRKGRKAVTKIKVGRSNFVLLNLTP